MSQELDKSEGDTSTEELEEFMDNNEVHEEEPNQSLHSQVSSALNASPNSIHWSAPVKMFTELLQDETPSVRLNPSHSIEIEVVTHFDFDQELRWIPLVS